MTFPIAQSLLEQTDLGVRYYVMIEGIPYVFLDGATPVGPTGAAWSAPSGGDDPYELLEDALDVDALPLRDSGVTLTRSASDVSPSAMQLLLRDHDDTLLGLFGRHKAGGKVVTLSGYLDIGASGVSVEDETGWSIGDYLYLGRETMVVTNTSAGNLDVSRSQFGLQYGETRYLPRTTRPGAPRTGADYPRVWHGRYVRVIAYLVNAASGRAIGSGFSMATGPFVAPGPTHEWEIWRGIMTQAPRATADWSSWEIICDGLEALLRTEIGFETMTAGLLRVASWQDAGAANRSGAFIPPASAPPELSAGYWLSQDNSRVECIVREWANATDRAADATPVVTTYTGADAIIVYPNTGTIVSRGTLITAFEDTVSAVLRTDTGLDAVSLSRSGNYWKIKITGTGVQVFEVTWLWDAPGSIGALLGIAAPSVSDSAQGAQQVVANAEGGGLAVSIPPEATAIPFWYDNEGQQNAPAYPGVAVIGDDDDAEVVAFAQIDAVGAAELDGVYKLTGVTRGLMGTTPRHFKVTQEQAKSGAEKVKIRFGVGWSERSLGEILLELLTSRDGTGWVDWDVLPPGVTPGLNPSHIDQQAFLGLASALTDWERLRTIVLTKSMRLGELAAQLLQPLGWWLFGATVDDGTYRLTVGQSLPALQSQQRLALTSRHIGAGEAPHFAEAGRVVNHLKILYRWRPVAHEFAEGAYVEVIDDDSVAEHGTRSKLEWRLIGLANRDAASVYTYTLGWAFAAFARFGRPYDVLRLPDVARVGWMLRPGDTVSVTVDDMPTTFGTRGVERTGTVLRVSKVYSGPEPGCQIDLALEAPDRYSTYCPAARITAWDGTTGVTLGASNFTAEPDYDYSHFEADDVCWVYKLEHDVSTRVTRTIASRSGSSVVFTVALPGGFAAGTDTLLTFADYVSCNARQRKFAFVADNTPELGATPTEAVRYV